MAGEALGVYNDAAADQRNGHKDWDHRFKFDRYLATNKKTLNPGKHVEAPFFETNNSIKYLDKHLK